MGPRRIQALGCSRNRIGCVGGGVVVLGFLWAWMISLDKPQFGSGYSGGLFSSLIVCVCVCLFCPQRASSLVGDIAVPQVIFLATCTECASLLLE